MTTRLASVFARTAQAAVRLVLLGHPRGFREEFGAEIDDAVLSQIESASAGGPVAAARAAGRAVVDAVRGIAVPLPPRGGRPHRFPEDRHPMRQMLSDALNDARLAVRGFRRQPGWTAAVILTLALGIGLNAAMFGVADRLLLSGPEHVHDPGRIRRLQITRQPPNRELQRDGAFPYAGYGALRQPSQVFTAVAGYAIYPDSMVVGRGADARRITRAEATASLFPLLGVTPAAGRFFTSAEDDTVAPEHVVVIGYELWQAEFGGRADAIGHAITLDNTTYTVVGVTPPGFTGPELTRVDAWCPESLFGRSRITNWTQSWNGWWLSIVVRLAPDATDDRADAAATAAIRNASPRSNAMLQQASVAVRPLTDDRSGSASMESRISTWLAAVAGIVLLVTCANVINLVVARGMRRRREIALRLALGAGRGRLIRLLTAEALILAVAGGLTGLGVAYVVGTLMRTWLLPGVAWPTGVVNLRVFAVSVGAAVLVGLVVGLLPAWSASAPHLSAALKTGVRDGGGRRQGARTALTVLQAALCALLLVGSGLFVVSLSRVRAMDLGLQPNRVLLVDVRRAGIPSTGTDVERLHERDRRLAFLPMVLASLQGRAAVESSALAIGLPFWAGFGEDIRVPGVDQLPPLKGPYMSAVTADYFKTVGTSILRGRAFTTADHAGTAPVAIVNETMARTIWPGKDAIGQCFMIENQTACTEIVGIAANTRRFKLEESEAIAFYVPFGQEKGIGGTSLLVRPRGSTSDALTALRRELFSLDASITYVDIQVLQDQVEPQMRPWELGATMFSLMGVLALVVAGVGLYSVMSYFVADRTHEIGVRMALGARPADLARLVIRGGLLLAIVGTAIGLGLALIAGRLIEPLLFHTSPRDPAVFGEVAAVLVGMAFVATVVPAARARGVNPIEAMRTE